MIDPATLCQSHVPVIACSPAGRENIAAAYDNRYGQPEADLKLPWTSVT